MQLQNQLVTTCAFPRLQWYPSPMAARDSHVPKQAPCVTLTLLPVSARKLPILLRLPTYRSDKTYLGQWNSHIWIFSITRCSVWFASWSFLHRIPLNEVLLQKWDTRRTGEHWDCAMVDGAWNTFARAQKCHRGAIFHTIQGYILKIFFILVVATKSLKHNKIPW